MRSAIGGLLSRTAGAAYASSESRSSMASGEYALAYLREARILAHGIEERVEEHGSKARIPLGPCSLKRCYRLVPLASLGIDLCDLIVRGVSVAPLDLLDRRGCPILVAGTNGQGGFTDKPAVIVRRQGIEGAGGLV